MKIIKNSDIKFRINKKLVYLPNFTIRFYTINQKEYFLEKTQDDLVEYQREATVDDVDVILSGGTTVTEYYLPLNWNQLMFVGKGVLNYKLTNNIEDPEFPDYQYNKEEIVTTDFYIDSIEVDPEPEEGLIERIVLLEEHLAEEIVNREQADATITENLNAEEARAISAETVLDEKIDAETNRATSAETALDTKLDQEIADRQTDVNAEEARAISAETALDEKIDAEETRATTAENELDTKIGAETTRATAAEAALDTKANTISGNVITETTRATAKEDAISGKLDTYIASNDAALQSEVTRATTAEEALQTAINDEATARANADTALQTAITNEVSRAKEAESGITNSLNAEVTRATGAEAALDAKIDTVSGNVISETSRATTAENALSGAIDSISAATSGSVEELDAKIDQEITDRTADVDAEEARAKGVENALSGAIDTLDVRFFDDAKYEDSGNTKVINFYNAGVVKATIDCTDFLVDGMIDDVRIENGYLVIDFNTASGKQDIQIPLTDIFNPNNYYTKSETSGATEISTALAQKLAISDFNTYSGTVDTAINSKASQSDLDALNGVVTAHTADTTVHVTTSDKTKWNKVDDKLDVTDFNTYSGTVDTALAQKQNQLVAGENITISGNVISSEGGGKAIEAGRGIAITTGETADTVSFDLDIYKHTGSTNPNIEIFGHPYADKGISTNKIKNNSIYEFIVGSDNRISGSGKVTYGTIIGEDNKIISDGNTSAAYIFGTGNVLSGFNLDGSTLIGEDNSGYTNYEFAAGYANECKNQAEVALGKYNVSSSASTTFGDSGNTLFSVGNGTYSARHNAFEIRQNGDIYLTLDGQDVKLQDQLGSGGGTVESAITSGSTNAVESKAIWSAVTYDVSINETLEFDDTTYAATNYPSGCNSVTFENNTGGTLPIGDYVFTSGGSEVAKLTCTVISWWPYEASWTSSNPKLTYVVAEGNSAVTASYSELASDIDGVTVTSAFTSAFTATASGENHLWINENTYRKDEVYNKSEINVLSGVVDTKLNTISGAVDTKLDATAYTPTVVDSTLNDVSNNPVANSALYDELRIGNGTVITFDSDNFSENYPVECRKIKVEVTETTHWSEIKLLSDKSESGSTDNRIEWHKYNSQSPLSVTLGSGLTEAGATYTIIGDTFEVSYPSINNIQYIYAVSPLHSYETIKAITGTSSSVTTLKDQVVENTTALGGLSLVKLTQAEYDALATKDNNTLYVIVG